MRSYSTDLRVRVLEDGDAGMATPAVAEKYRVSKSWVRRLKQRRRETGETLPREQRRRGRVPLHETHGDALRQAVRDDPHATLAELRAKLGLTVALSTVWRALDRLGLSLEKR